MDYPLIEDSWGEEEKRAIQTVLASGRYTMGEKVAEFERMFSEKFHVPHVVMTSSGSAANLIGIAALCYKKDKPLKRGDEVIVPAVSWCTTYYPLQQYGLKLRFVDVELDTLNIDVRELEKAFTARTRMVLAVNILGNPARLFELSDFCFNRELYLFEDNCESMGATLHSKLCGTFGDIGTFSTFFSHHLSTMEGGMLATYDEELYHIARSLRAHGWTRDMPKRSPVYSKSDDDDFEAYRFILPGYNVRPLEMEAAAGIEQLKKLDRSIALRRKNADIFKKLFEGDDRFIIQKEIEGARSSWFTFTVLLNPTRGYDRKKIWKGLREAGIEFRLITGGNFLRHPVIKYFDYSAVCNLPNADTIHDYGFYVGNFSRDLTRELHYFHDTLVKLAS